MKEMKSPELHKLKARISDFMELYYTWKDHKPIMYIEKNEKKKSKSKKIIKITKEKFVDYYCENPDYVKNLMKNLNLVVFPTSQEIYSKYLMKKKPDYNAIFYDIMSKEILNKIGNKMPAEIPEDY
jgi:hypothetical protein